MKKVQNTNAQAVNTNKATTKTPEIVTKMTTTKAPESKAEMLAYLEEINLNAKALKLDKNFMERLNYTLDQAHNNPKNVLKSDLAELLNEAIEVVKSTNKPKPAEKPVEKSTKTADKPTSKTAALKKKDETKAVKVETSKKVEEKPATTKEEKKSKELFPATVTTKELGKLTKVKGGKFDTYKELLDTINADDFDGELYILVPWTPEQIKKYRYSEVHDVPEVESFPNGFDILQVVVACERIERFYAQSAYTDAMFEFEGDDLVPKSYTDGAGKILEARISYGMEFEFYTK